MAGRIGLVAYVIRIKKARNRAGWAEMTRGGAVDGFKLIKEYLEKQRNQLVGADGEAASNAMARVFRPVRVDVHEPSRSIWGIIQGGEYGRTGDIVDTTTRALKHRKSRRECELSPFYFRFQIPDGSSRALLLLQRNGFANVKGVLERYLKSHLGKLDLTMEMGALTHEAMLHDYLKGGDLQAVHVIAHQKAADSQEMLKKSRVDGEPIEDGTKVEVVIRRYKGMGKIIDTVRSVVGQQKPMSDLVEVYGLERPEDVVVDISYEGRKRSFNILHPGESGVSYDVGDKIEYDDGGHPLFRSIDDYAKDLCAELRKKIS